MIKKQKLSEQVLTILSTAEIDGSVVRLTSGQLDRKLYLEVNKALEALGGKWDRKAKGHIFKDNPAERLDFAILTGEVTLPSKNGYFPTPKAIVLQMIELADIQPHQEVLEPSAGKGNIAIELRARGAYVQTCEMLDDNRVELDALGFMVYPERDFMKIEVGRLFDRVVMNPPFEARQDVKQVLLAFSMLKPGGKLASVMSAGVTFRDDKLGKYFRDFVYTHSGQIIPLPEGSFEESGTNVNTVIVTMEA